ASGGVLQPQAGGRTGRRRGDLAGLWRGSRRAPSGSLRTAGQGAYRASPVQRGYVPKADGRQRPIGVPVLEDKIVQKATVALLNQLYETEFLGFSYGFHLGRSPHDALAALDRAIFTKKLNYVLDADIRAFS